MNSGKVLGITTIALVLVLNQQVGYASNICDNPTCVEEASKIKGYIDTSANPCEDFYQFACGTFLKKPNDKYKMWGNLENKIKHELLDIVQESIQEDDHKMVKAAKKLYHTCLDEDQILPDFVKSVKKITESVGGWPVVEGENWNETNFDWLNATYALRRQGYEYEAFLKLYIEENSKGGDKVLVLRQERDRFAKPDIQTIAKVAKLVGANNEEHVMKELERTYHAFDYMWLNSFTLNYEKQTIAEIQEKDGVIDWLEYFNNIVGPKIQLSKTDFVEFPINGYISQGFEKLAEVPKRGQSNYIIWQAIQPLYSLVLKLESQRNATNKNQETREEYCSTMTTKYFTTSVPNPLEVIKLRRHLPKEKKIIIEKMISYIKTASIEGLNKIDWLPENIKQKYLKKIEDHKVIVGLSEDYFDDNIFDEADVDMGQIEDDATFFDILAKAQRNLETLEFTKLKKVFREIIESPYAPAEYSTIVRDNYVYIPTILCEEPFFDDNRPDSFNYASLGTLISTLLWDRLSREAREEATSLKECLLNKTQESDQEAKEIVEFEAVRMTIVQEISRSAYETSTKENGEDSNLISTQYSPNQLFWISFGALHCEPTDSFEFVTMMRHFAQKELTKAVVSESLRLNPNFAQDFSCPADSKLNPSNKCKIF